MPYRAIPARDPYCSRWRSWPSLELVAALLLTLNLTLGGGSAAQAASGGPDAFGYTWADQDEPFVTSTVPLPTGAQFEISIVDEQLSAPLNLGFPFPYYGATYTQLRFSDNGWLTFDPTLIASPNPDPLPIAATLPSLFAPPAVIAPLWLDLIPMALPTTLFVNSVEGGVAIRYSANPRGSNDLVRFHVVLFRSGQIKVKYDFVPLIAASQASVGIQNERRDLTLAGLQPWFQTTGSEGFELADDSVLQFTPRARLDCAGATPIACNQPLAASSPVTLAVNIDAYSCSPKVYSGREVVFDLQLSDTTDLSLALSDVLPLGTDLDILVLARDTCDEYRCIASGDQVDLSFLQPGNYRIVVDGVDPTAASFTLTPSCAPRGTTLSCGDGPVAGQTMGVSAWHDWPCAPAIAYGGPEELYEITLPSPGILRATVADHPGGDVDVFILPRNDVQPSACLAYGDEDAVLFAAPAGDYVVVVDGRDNFAGSFELTVDCGPGLDCQQSHGQLVCGQTRFDSTWQSDNGAQRYNCTTELLSGPEVIFDFDHAGGDAAFTIVGDPGLRVSLLAAGCDEGACIASGAGRLLVRDLAPGNYRVVVDGADGAVSDFSITPICGNQILPDALVLPVRPGECVTADLAALMLPSIEAVDVLFAVDVSSTQGVAITALDGVAPSIVAALAESGASVSFALASFSDYAGAFQSCSPAVLSTYGGSADYPYRLDLAMTSDPMLLSQSLAGLNVRNGADYPESYARALHEAYVDMNVGWRANSHRVVIMTGDDVPHDCDVGACLGQPGAFASRGVDPGRDAIIATADDLDVRTEIAGLAAACTQPFLLHSWVSGTRIDDLDVATVAELWRCWLAGAGGDVFDFASGQFPLGSDVPASIRSRVEAQSAVCNEVYLTASVGFESWLQSVTPSGLGDVALPAAVDFRYQLCVPAGTALGTYDLTVDVGCGCATAGQQAVRLLVNECEFLPSIDIVGATCPRSSITLDAGASSIVGCPGQLEHRWLDLEGNVVTGWSADPTLPITVTSDTSYTVEIRCVDQLDCPGSHSAEVPIFVAPPADAGPNRVVCELGSTTIGPATCLPNLSYTWWPATYLDATDRCNPRLTTGSGNTAPSWIEYTLTVTDPASNCQSADSMIARFEPGGTDGEVGNRLRVVRAGDDVHLDWQGSTVSPWQHNVHRTSLVSEIDRRDYSSPIAATIDGTTWTDVGNGSSGAASRFYDVFGRRCDGTSQLP